MELSREHIRAIIYYEWTEVKDATEIHARISRHLGQAAVSKSTVEYWMRKFRLGQHSLEDEHRSGRPSSSNTDANIDTVRELERRNPRITYDEIERETGISRRSIHKIMHETLGLHKVMCRFIPHRLTEEQKKVRIETCRENLKMWKDCGTKMIDRIITGDKTYVYYYDAATRSESKLWVFEDETPPQVVKTSRASGKVLFAVFFRSAGLVIAVKLEGQKSTPLSACQKSLKILQNQAS
jgi:transposase